MANIMKGLGAFRKDKCRLLKVGSISMNYGYGKTTSATLDIKSVYSNYADLTVDDICFPLTYSRGWGEGFGATLSSFKKSYNPSSGMLTVSATGSYNYCNTQFTCDVYILDRVGGGVIDLLLKLFDHLFLRKEVIVNG